MVWEMFFTLASNLGVGLETVALIVLVTGSLIFFAQDFKIGVIMLMMSGILGFIFFYNESMNYKPFITIFFMALVILALSLYPISKQESRGGVI